MEWTNMMRMTSAIQRYICFNNRQYISNQIRKTKLFDFFVYFRVHFISLIQVPKNLDLTFFKFKLVEKFLLHGIAKFCKFHYFGVLGFIKMCTESFILGCSLKQNISPDLPLKHSPYRNIENCTEEQIGISKKLGNFDFSTSSSA